MGVKRMGVAVVETAGTPPKPWRLWRADLLQCPICGKELLGHFSHEPVAEQHDVDFEAALDAASKSDRYVVYSAETLAIRVTHETVYVKKARSHVSN
jgi:hypothetical protein